MKYDKHQNDPSLVNSLRCSHCGANLPAGASFCPNCQAVVHQKTPSCLNCGAFLRPQTQFCSSCDQIFEDFHENCCPLCGKILHKSIWICPYCHSYFKDGKTYLPPEITSGTPPKAAPSPEPAPKPEKKREEPLHQSQPQVLEKPRIGFRILKIILYFNAVIMSFATLAEGSYNDLFATIWFFLLGYMFSVLSRTPKSEKKVLLFGTYQMSKTFFVVFVTFIFPFFMSLFSELSSSTDPPRKTVENTAVVEEKEPEPAPYMDAAAFANLSSAELVEKLGDPPRYGTGKFSGTIDMPCTYYEYDIVGSLSNVRFILVQDRIIQFSSTAEMALPASDKDLSLLGIELSKDCIIIPMSDTERVYRCSTDKIDDIVMKGINQENNTFSSLKVTYDISYASEWGMFILKDSEEHALYYNKTKTIIYDTLFPQVPRSNINMSNEFFNIYVKNSSYVKVDGYVEAPNTYGTVIRHFVRCIYDVETTELKRIELDKQTVYDNNYVPLPDLLKEKLETPGTSSEI